MNLPDVAVATAALLLVAIVCPVAPVIVEVPAAMFTADHSMLVPSPPSHAALRTVAVGKTTLVEVALFTFTIPFNI